MEKRSLCRVSRVGLDKLEMEKTHIYMVDLLHYLSVLGNNWRLTLWHYNPPSKAPTRKGLHWLTICQMNNLTYVLWKSSKVLDRVKEKGRLQ